LKNEQRDRGKPQNTGREKGVAAKYTANRGQQKVGAQEESRALRNFKMK